MARTNLLGSIRKDIKYVHAQIRLDLVTSSLADWKNSLSAYKSSLPQHDQGRTDALLNERGRIDSSNRMTDEILE